jgi:hypothetical protein
VRGRLSLKSDNACAVVQFTAGAARDVAVFIEIGPEGGESERGKVAGHTSPRNLFERDHRAVAA